MPINIRDKQILIIGTGDSVFVKDFIDQYEKRGVTVDLISTGQAEISKSVRTQINVVPDPSGIFGKTGKHIKLIKKIRRSVKMLPSDYDAVIIHSINIFLAPSISMLKMKAKRIVAVVWGSDYYRSTRAQDIFKNRIYRAADSIVFTNPKTLRDFSKKNPHISPENLRIARFGLPVLDEIDKLKGNIAGKDDLPYSTFGLPADKIIVLAGYSGSLAHRQDLAIDATARLPPETRDLIHLVFPIGYGASGIKKTIEEKLNQAHLDNYTILTDFYGFPDAAKLRCVTDILINIQSSDQFSGSMQETLYAGGHVIAGAWLPYQEIIAAGAKIKLVDKPEDLSTALQELAAAHRRASAEPAQAVKQYIKNASSWSANIGQWDSIIFANHA